LSSGRGLLITQPRAMTAKAAKAAELPMSDQPLSDSIGSDSCRSVMFYLAVGRSGYDEPFV